MNFGETRIPTSRRVYYPTSSSVLRMRGGPCGPAVQTFFPLPCGPLPVLAAARTSCCRWWETIARGWKWMKGLFCPSPGQSPSIILCGQGPARATPDRKPSQGSSPNITMQVHRGFELSWSRWLSSWLMRTCSHCSAFVSKCLAFLCRPLHLKRYLSSKSLRFILTVPFSYCY